MNAILYLYRSTRLCSIFGAILCTALLGMPNEAHAICGLDGAALEQIRSVNDPQAMSALSRKIHLYGTCSICHLARFGGPRNEFGNVVNTLLTLRDREDKRYFGKPIAAQFANLRRIISAGAIPSKFSGEPRVSLAQSPWESLEVREHHGGTSQRASEEN